MPTDSVLSKLAVTLFVGLFLALLLLAVLDQGTGWQRFAIAGEIVMAFAPFGVQLGRVRDERGEDIGSNRKE
jgi:hypothetical protein